MGCFEREEKGYVEETAKWDYIVSALQDDWQYHCVLIPVPADAR